MDSDDLSAFVQPAAWVNGYRVTVDKVQRRLAAVRMWQDCCATLTTGLPTLG